MYSYTLQWKHTHSLTDIPVLHICIAIACKVSSPVFRVVCKPNVAGGVISTSNSYLESSGFESMVSWFSSVPSDWNSMLK
jgi:hypothetical protein